MKTAYIILAYNSPGHFRRLVRAIDHPSNSIYIHIDKKSDFHHFRTSVKNHIYFEENRHKVYWGEFSQVDAQLKLLRKAILKDTYDYFILLYGSDYPVRNLNYIHEYLSQQKAEHINIIRMPGAGKTLDRIQYYRLLQANRNKSLHGLTKRAINYSIRALDIKRQLPHKYRNMTLFGGSSWWILSRECIKYVLEFIDQNPDYIKFWKHTLIPDETFFHTIIGNSKFIDRVKPNVMYTNWIIGESNPRIISENDFPILKVGKFTNDFGTHDILFARKFDDSSGSIVEKIDRELIHK